jgi:hypothetical protein
MSNISTCDVTRAVPENFFQEADENDLRAPKGATLPRLALCGISVSKEIVLQT